MQPGVQEMTALTTNSVKKQMQILGANIGAQMKPVFQTKMIGTDYIVNNVICTTQIMSSTPSDIYTSALTSTNILQSGDTLSNMVC